MNICFEGRRTTKKGGRYEQIKVRTNSNARSLWPLSWRRIAENAGRCNEQLLCLLPCTVAITHTSDFFGFYGFDQRLIVTETFPGTVVEAIFFPQEFFVQYAFAIPREIADKFVVIIKG